MDRAAGSVKTSETWLLQRHQQFMLKQQLIWQRTRDPLALLRAVAACSMLHKPQPDWLNAAVQAFIEDRLTDAERRKLGDVAVHLARWEAVRLALGRLPYHGRNVEGGMSWDECWPRAAEMLKGTENAGSADTVRKSYILIQAAGGAEITLESYQRAVQKRDGIG